MAGQNYKFIIRAVLAVSVILGMAAAHNARAAEKVDFLLDWVPGGFHLPWYAALDKGFYKEEGLDVKIHRGYGSGDTVKKVALKQYDVGFATLGAVIQARANENVPVKGIMVYLARDMSAIWYRDEGEIKTPKDLEGKKLAAPVGDGNRLLFPAFARAAKIDANKVNWVTVEGQSKTPLLLNKQIDGTPFFAYHGPRLRAQAAELGIKLGVFPYSDYGLSLYSSNLLAHDDVIRERPDMLAKFVRATQKGIRWAADHPEEAGEIITKYAAEVDGVAATAEWEVTMNYVLVEEALNYGLGRYEPDRLKNTIDLHFELMNMERSPAPEEVATSQFAPK